MSKIGQMRHLVTIQSTSNSADGGGGYTQSWSTVEAVYAAIKPASGRESYRQGQIQDDTTHEITIRHRAMNANYRISFDSRLFNIKSIKNIDERNRYMVLSCTEGVAV